MQITLCAKCLETKCECEFYRRRFPKEWAARDKLGYCPVSVAGVPRIILDVDGQSSR